MDYSLIYITASNREEAKSIAETLVRKRLVACANIIPKIESYYWWKGKICCDEEVLIFVKTTNKLVKKVISEVKKIHSYEVPAIVALNIFEGNPEFLNWISKETEPENSR